MEAQNEKKPEKVKVVKDGWIEWITPPPGWRPAAEGDETGARPTRSLVNLMRKIGRFVGRK